MQQFQLRTLFFVIAGIGVTLAIGRMLGPRLSLAILCLGGFIVPAAVKNFWLRACLAIAMTGGPIFAFQLIGLGDSEPLALPEALSRSWLVIVGVGIGALAVSSRLHWDYCHPRRK